MGHIAGVECSCFARAKLVDGFGDGPTVIVNSCFLIVVLELQGRNALTVIETFNAKHALRIAARFNCTSYFNYFTFVGEELCVCDVAGKQ